MRDAPEHIPSETFSTQSQCLGRLDLTLIQHDGRQALEDVDKDFESAY